MAAAHPEGELVPFLRGELASAERERVARHLDGCDDCRRIRDDVRELLDDLAHPVVAPPPVDWQRYRAELRAKLDRTSRAPARRWWWRTAPLALSTALASVLVLLVVQGGLRPDRAGEPLTAMEETVIGDRLDLLRQYEVVERLELLEDLDLIGQLDRIAPVRDS